MQHHEEPRTWAMNALGPVHAVLPACPNNEACLACGATGLGCVALSTGTPLELVRPEILRFKAFEPILIIGRQRLKNLDIRLRVRGGGNVAQIYGAQPLFSLLLLLFLLHCHRPEPGSLEADKARL